MKRLTQKLFYWLVRLLLGLRYRVRVEGAEQLADLEGPFLVLPNHPAYVDPPIVVSHVALPDAVLRPLVFSGTYRKPMFYPVMRLIQALEVPDLQSYSQDARGRTHVLIDRVVERISQGESFLIYPSGRLQRQGHEVVGAARAAAEVLARCPDVQVVLVRTRGLWGSMFGCAESGQLPNLNRCALRGLASLLGSLFFFCPRRDVHLSVQPVDRSELPPPTRDALNPFLEDWYNQDGSESPRFVPYHHIFGRRDFDFPNLDPSSEVDLEKIPADVRAAVNEMVEEHLRRELGDHENRSDQTLDAIGLDSLDRMDVALQIEERFGFRSHSVAATLGQLWALAAGQSIDARQSITAPASWSQPPASVDADCQVLCETVLSALVNRAAKAPRSLAAADQLAGGVTFRRLLMGVDWLSSQFKTLEGDAVALMLPASVAADIAYLALLAAGKTPVFLNWTTGPRNLQHAVESLKIRHVITSHRFVDRLGIEIEGTEYVFLEDLSQKMNSWNRMTLLVRALAMPKRLSRQTDVSPDDIAAILFTSGSENVPKAVPLTHRNLISNIRSGLSALQMSTGDRLLGFLPPFHSFGLTANMLLPLLTGVRVVHHADPTDAAGLVATISAYRPTLLFSTPTFLNYLCNIATADDFSSLRVIITGAEQCPEHLRQRCLELAPQAVISEGYGITECSPVVSVNRPTEVRNGSIGQVLDGLHTQVVHPESRESLSANEIGLLLVRGPSVFGGYLNYEGPSPFVEMDGHRWYNTGDLVSIDHDGYIFFQGRLKRFLKVGGEMVSLPALEAPLVAAHPADDDGPHVAVEGVETEAGRHIVAFVTFEISVRQANRILEEAGFRGIMRLDDVCRLEQIPVLGTGKTDYKILRQRVEDMAAMTDGR